jgi:lauroyl/myristoyl acyltransferase
MGNKLLFLLARGFIRLLQFLPLRLVARLGRAGGALAYWIDARHRKVALRNLALCFERETSAEERRAIAKENFRRIGENFACAVKTACMTKEELDPHLKFADTEKILPPPGASPPHRCVVAIGHFGNFELYARYAQFIPVYECATTYRGLGNPALDRLMRSIRERSGCLFFERRTDAEALKTAMNEKNLLLGLLADQHAGRSALRIPFFGHECSTGVAPAVFAKRYECRLFTGICYRTALAQWRIEAGEEIPLQENGMLRSTEAIMLDVNRAFEAAVRRDPANWFWVHNRWKGGPQAGNPQ